MPLAAVAAAAIGAGATIYSTSQANSANKKAVAAQQDATNQQLQLQQQQYDQTRADYAPYRQAGYSSLDALLGRFGLGNSQATGFNDNGYNGQITGTNDGRSGSTAGQPDYAAYVQNNPDILAEAQKVIAQNPQSIGDLNGDGTIDTTDYGINHARVFHDRPVPTTQATATDPNAQPAQTAEQQLQTQNGAEPTFAPRETYVRPGFEEANVGLDQFQASPDYNFRLQEGSRNLNAFNAAKGVLGSGAAMKGLIDYGQNTAAAEYGNWRNYVTGQTDKRNAFAQDAFSQDRAYGTDIYNTDRANTLNRYDTNRNYNTNRTDRATSNLFNLANLGSGAQAQVTDAGQNYANNSGNILQNNANAVSNAFSSTAQNNAWAANNIAGGLTNLANAFGTKTSAGYPQATSTGWGSGYSTPNPSQYQWGII